MLSKKDYTGGILWLMGPTSSGKTTIAEALKKSLRASGHNVMHFDGDEVRDFFGPNLGFEAEDRLRVVNTIIHLAKKAREAGVLVIVSALTANEDARTQLYKSIPDVMVGYVKCPLDVCAARDPKGLYDKAFKGEIKTLIGVNGQYSEPESPDIVLESNSKSVKDLVEELEDMLLGVPA